MAWISVDQKVLGGKLRKTFKDIGCSQSEALGILVSLWLWAIDNTDPDGLIVGADRSDVAEQIRVGVINLDPEEVVDKLVSNGWIDEPEPGKIYIHDWFEWREFYNRYVNGKEKNAEKMRAFREKKKIEPSEEVSGKTKKKSPYSTDFEQFWLAYPRHDDKGMAYKKYKARLNDGYSPEQLLTAATRYAEQIRRERTEKRYTKQAKTFLSDTLPFTDYLPGMQEEQAVPQGTGKSANPFRR